MKKQPDAFFYPSPSAVPSVHFNDLSRLLFFRSSRPEAVNLVSFGSGVGVISPAATTSLEAIVPQGDTQPLQLLVVAATFNKSWQGHQHDGESNNREGEIDNIHSFYEFNNLGDFISQRLINQNIIASAVPLINSPSLNRSRTAGNTTEATKTIPKSEQISASFSNWESDSFTDQDYSDYAGLSNGKPAWVKPPSTESLLPPLPPPDPEPARDEPAAALPPSAP